MKFLYLLESIRTPWLDNIFAAITNLGDEIAFLVIALVLFWCVDKRQGYYILAVGFIGTIANQFMKLVCRVPRPWVIDPEFTIVEKAREGATGYSFPSGHTQSAVGTFGGLAYITNNKIIRGLAIAIAILVPFSRMYLGVHTPLDVGVAVLMAIVLIFILRPVVMSKHKKSLPILLTVMTAIAVGFLCYVEFYPFPADMDQHNLASGMKNAYTLMGSLLGLLVVYILDEKWLHFPVNGIWWAQILKVAGGLVLVLAVKSGLKAPLDLLCGGSIGRAMRYFLIVIVAGIIWPLTFKWFSKLGKK